MGPLRSLPLKSNKDKKREFFKKRLRASFLKKRPRQLTRKKFLKSIRPSSLNLKLPESLRKLSKPSSERSKSIKKRVKRPVKRLIPLPRKLRSSSPLLSRRRRLTLKIEKLPSLPRLKLLPLRLLNWRPPLRRQPRRLLILEKKLKRKFMRPTLLLLKEKSSRHPLRLWLLLRNLRFKNRLIRSPLTSLPSRRMLRLTLLRERRLSLKRPLLELS